MRIPKVHKRTDSSAITKSNPKGAPRDSKEERALKKEYETAQVTLSPSEYVDDLSLFEDDPKELHKFVVRTKFLIRKSYEYSELMKFVKKYRGMNRCGVHPNVSKWDGFQIEIHHILTIEDIIYIIINKRLKKGESMKQSAIAKEVMYDHYLGLIGLYPLCQLCHEYVHSDENDLFIPLDILFGDLEAFFDIYSDYIADPLKVKFRNLQEMTKGYNIISNEIPDKLKRHLIYIDDGKHEGVSQTKLYDLIVELNKD
jgi:hypothetical protein